MCLEAAGTNKLTLMHHSQLRKLKCPGRWGAEAHMHNMDNMFSDNMFSDIFSSPVGNLSMSVTDGPWLLQVLVCVTVL